MRTDNANIIAVWGSPNSGKTTFATKLATAIYDNYQATVVVLYCDLETPALPVIFPNEKAEDLGSVGVPLSKTEVEMDDILQNAITLKQRGNLVFLGYRTGDNKYTFPKFGRAKAEALIELICEHTDYLIIDCTSNLDNNVLSATGIEMADQIIRLASPDLKCISFYLSQLPVYADSKYKLNEHIQGINTPMEIDEYYVDEFDCRTERNPQTELYRLMQDCKTGNIGLVLVPITRNMTNDSATTRKYVHELLELPRPVGVYFEYENVYSLAPNGMEELDKALAYWDYHRKIKSRRSCFHTNARFNQIAKGVTLDITLIPEFQ